MIITVTVVLSKPPVTLQYTDDLRVLRYPFVSKNLDAEHIAQTACPCHSLNDWDIVLEAKGIIIIIVGGC